MPDWWAIPVAGAFFLSTWWTDVVRAFALRGHVVDAPGKDGKMHERPTPLLGGVAVYAAVSIVLALVLVFTDHLTSGEMTARHILALIIGGWVLIIGGAVDDAYVLKPYQSVLFPLLASLIAVLSGIGVSKVTNPFGGAIEISDAVSGVLTFVWLMGVIYTTKLLDGLDGLAAGVSGIGALMIALLALSAAYFQPDVALMALVALGALLGFLVWNVHPAQIFLGEGGSTFIGYLIGILAVISGSKIATALLVVGVPAIDVAFVIVERWREGRPVFRGGDRKHLHQRLVDAGLSHRQVVILYYVFAAGFGATSLLFESWQKLFALLLLFVIMLVFVKSLSSRISYEHEKR